MQAVIMGLLWGFKKSLISSLQLQYNFKYTYLKAINLGSYNQSLKCFAQFLTETIDDVPDDDGVDHLVLPQPPGHGVADEPHPHPPYEAAHSNAGEQPAGRGGVNAF